MSSGKPLLSTSEPSSATSPHHRRHSSLTIGSLGRLCHNTSISSSVTDGSQHSNLCDHNDELEDELKEEFDEDISPLGGALRNSVECPAYLRTRKKFKSVDLQVQLPLPERKLLVSWGGVTDPQHVWSMREVSGASSQAVSSGIQDYLNKSQRSERFLQISMQLKENLTHHDNPRLIHINDPKRTNDNFEYSGNEIRTSKYTFLNFLPKNLFIQFHRVAYLYFLAIAALNQLPPLAVFGRTVSLVPLLFVLTVTAVKDGYEDWRRHRSDRNENNREALVLQSGEFHPKRWKKLQSGEVVKICSDETIPCDMVLLTTSDPSGIAYIQTMNLDGESNLKTRYARQETNKLVLDGTIISGVITCEQPNRNIYEFTANLEIKGQRYPLNQSNIILRGCQLKNTEWAIGVVVYAGKDTKAMLNSAMSPAKRSRLETYMNRETFWLSVFLLIMCLVVAIGMGLWLNTHKNQLDTLPYYRKIYFDKKKFGEKYKYYGIPMETFFSFLSSIIVFQIMIPISLYITMELVRLGQSYFMIGDRHMYDSSSDSRFQCRSLNINEDLGQIRYVFSDKTGTLTENKMEFRKASVWGKQYGSTLSVDGTGDTNVGAGRKLQKCGWMNLECGWIHINSPSPVAFKSIDVCESTQLCLCIALASPLESPLLTYPLDSHGCESLLVSTAVDPSPLLFNDSECQCALFESDALSSYSSQEHSGCHNIKQHTFEVLTAMKQLPMQKCREILKAMFWAPKLELGDIVGFSMSSSVWSSWNTTSLLLMTFFVFGSHNLYPNSSSPYPIKMHEVVLASSFCLSFLNTCAKAKQPNTLSLAILIMLLTFSMIVRFILSATQLCCGVGGTVFSCRMPRTGISHLYCTKVAGFVCCEEISAWSGVQFSAILLQVTLHTTIVALVSSLPSIFGSILTFAFVSSLTSNASLLSSLILRDKGMASLTIDMISLPSGAKLLRDTTNVSQLSGKELKS
ncbi:phospholipid-transporting ATPase 1-like, partial [Olea europaea subsp. europaea]